MKKTIKQAKKSYKRAKETGMFWEWFPEMTGIWPKDMDDYIAHGKRFWNWEMIDYEEDA